MKYLGIDENKDVSVSSKLRLNRKIYHSEQLLTDRKKKSSNFIKYSKNNCYYFGSISYFFSCDQKIYVSLYKYNLVKDNLFSDLIGNLNPNIQNLKKNGEFSKFFFVLIKLIK